MVEPERPLKRKDQIMINEEVANNLEAQMQAELEEEDRLARQKEKKDNITLIESWDNTQAMIDADNELAQRLQTEEQGELTIEEKSRQRLEKKNESAKLKRCLEIVPDDDDAVTIEAIPPFSKSLTIVDNKIYKEGRKSYFKIIRADGNSQNYLIFRKMFKIFNREDLKVLWSIVKARFKKTKPVDDMDNLLF
uniref:Uncharacterized protein n=1 Tax=Tanacetum cinerariifolium TaxID=118510 RepID=A0A699HHA7_TANCI|nr:hypothetical protein [Tanacetum cinerariifolium]